MKHTVVRYKAKADSVSENQRLIEQVFEELKANSPPGIRYVSLRLEDGTFVHFASYEDGAQPLTELKAFKAFQSAIAERCIEQPKAAAATVVGNYRMLASDDR